MKFNRGINSTIRKHGVTYTADESEFASMGADSLERERHVIDHGAIIYCYGRNSIQVNFDTLRDACRQCIDSFPAIPFGGLNAVMITRRTSFAIRRNCSESRV